MANYLLSVVGLSAAASLFIHGESTAPSTWAWAGLALLAAVVMVRSFAHAVFGAPPHDL